MAARNKQFIKPKFWIPPEYTANWRVTVERTDGVVDDVTDEILSLNIIDTITDGIGTFEFEIPNPNETYTAAWTGMEIFRYYADYASGTPTTLRFRGRIEKPSKKENNVKVTGRSESLFVTEQTVTVSYTTEDIAVILKDLFSAYGGGRFDTGSIPATINVFFTVDWIDIPFWDAVEVLCNASGYDCYIDADLVVQFFSSGSKDNTTDGLVHERNILEVGDFAPDLQFIKNKIRVYGSTQDNTQIIYTANDLTSQGTYGIRRENITSDNIITLAEAKDIGDYELSVNNDPPIVGSIRGTLLATIQPGQNILISAPFDGLDFGDYRVIKYEHKISEEGLFTVVTINKEPKMISHVFKDRIKRDNRRQGSERNTFDLDFATTENFSVDVGSHDNTEIVDGVLKKLSTGSDGVWVSPIHVSSDDNDLFQVAVSPNGTNIPGMTFEISFNGGGTYNVVSIKQLSTITASNGTNLVLKVTLVDDDTQLDSYTVQYSTQ